MISAFQFAWNAFARNSTFGALHESNEFFGPANGPAPLRPQTCQIAGFFGTNISLLLQDASGAIQFPAIGAKNAIPIQLDTPWSNSLF
jgi:hypothetical protein